MEYNKKILKLIDMGLTTKTLNNLTESQINTLFNKFGLNEQGVVTMRADKATQEPEKLKNLAAKGVNVRIEGDMTEDEVDPMDVFKGQVTQQPHQVGASTDMDDPSGSVDGMPTEGELGEKKKTKDNAWAICTTTMGDEFGTTKRSDWSDKQLDKYERCVRDVKKSVKEGKDPYHFLIEKEIVSLVERNLSPKMTKSDFLKTIMESPTTAPTKPTTKPGVKPTTKPRTRPSHPGKNPNPGENPSPKAKDIEKAKDEVIDVIMKLLSNGEKN